MSCVFNLVFFVFIYRILFLYIIAFYFIFGIFCWARGPSPRPIEPLFFEAHFEPNSGPFCSHRQAYIDQPIKLAFLSRDHRRAPYHLQHASCMAIVLSSHQLGNLHGYLSPCLAQMTIDSSTCTSPATNQSLSLTSCCSTYMARTAHVSRPRPCKLHH